jgi:hypothetical protein
MSVSNKEVENTRREADFMYQLSHNESGQGSKLGALHNDGVPGCESGANLPAQQQNCGSVGRRILQE